MSVLKSMTALGLVATLAACNGGDLASIPINPAPGEALSRAEIAEISEDIFEGVRDETATPKSLVPVSGSADYFGTVQADVVTSRAASDLAGLVEMNVNFGTDRVRGAMGNFVEADGDRVTGVLDLENGRLNRTSNSREVAIFSDVRGDLRGPGGERISVDADLSGGFAGRDVEYIGAEIDGAVSVDGRAGTIEGLTALER